MRLITWNCRAGGFWRKAKRVEPLAPDVLVVQELEPRGADIFQGGDRQPTFCMRVAEPQYPRRGLGVFSFGETRLEPEFDVASPTYGFLPFVARREDLTFHVIAVWTFSTAGNSSTHYRQAHKGLAHYESWIRQRPTVVLGDFNIGPSDTRLWRDLIALVEPLDLVSAYHRFFADETHGVETRPTYVHGGKSRRPRHIDYCWLPRAWASRISSVEVGRHEGWSDVSDHRPLVVDVDV